MAPRPFTLTRPLVLALLTAAGGSAFAAGGDDWGRFARDVDPNGFVVGHPASPRWQVAHANHEHPGVAAARQARDAGIDANTFLVQPPAPVTWRDRAGEEGARSVAEVPPADGTQAH